MNAVESLWPQTTSACDTRVLSRDMLRPVLQAEALNGTNCRAISITYCLVSAASIPIISLTFLHSQRDVKSALC